MQLASVCMIDACTNQHLDLANPAPCSLVADIAEPAHEIRAVRYFLIVTLFNPSVYAPKSILDWLMPCVVQITLALEPVQLDSKAAKRSKRPVHPIYTAPRQRTFPNLPTTSLMIPTRPSNPQHKVHHHRCQQRNCQHGRPKPIIKPFLPTHPNTLCPPMERHERVEHGGERNEREEAGGDLADTVAKVEEADGQAAEDDGEVEPGEEGAFVSEEDFGLYAGGQGDALACEGA